MGQYSDYTYDTILSDAKSVIKDDIQKGEGSLVHNAIASCAYEIEKLYIQLDYLTSQSHADTADYEHLKLIGADRGLTPIDATYGTYSGEFDVKPPIGTRFNLGQYNYKVTADPDSTVTDSGSGKTLHVMTLTCETSGTSPNGMLGDLTMIDYVQNLTIAKLVKQIVAGRDYETRDHFFKRYCESLISQSFAGNVSSYKEYINSFDGVGGCRVHPIWNGGGTVKITVIGSDYNVISDELKNSIQDSVCPVPSMGYGMSPIGHDVTVVSAEAVKCVFKTTITFETGFSWSTLKSSIEDKAKNYLLSLREGWADLEKDKSITVYISRVEAAILNVPGIKDINGTTINGSTSNLALTADQIPVYQSIASA